MSKSISDEWFSTLPEQFRPERIVKEELSFYEVDTVGEMKDIPSCTIGSVCIVRNEKPQMYMKSTSGWIPQTQESAEPQEVTSDGD